MTIPRRDQPDLRILNFRTAGAGSTLPVGSIAWTANRCFPGLSLEAGLKGEVQGANCPRSSWHWKTEFGSVDVKWNFGRRFLDFFLGHAVIAVSGGEMSGGAGVTTWKLRVAVAKFPATSVARTRNV